MEKLGGFEFWEKTLGSARLVVAPMVDQSELAWRLLSRRYGAELCYTPMLHASVFERDANYRREALQSCKEDRPLIVQFCGNDPDTVLKAALKAQAHCDAIDLNLGCPQSIARRGHYGAFLQDEWDLLTKIVKTCHENLAVPITCKIRIFEDVEKTVKYAKMLEDAGCQLLTVHGRTREQKGPITGIACWKHIKAIRENVKIPVFANGNIQYFDDVKKCMEETGVQGVMSAEGNLHNPALFKGINPEVWTMANEYLDFVEKYPCPLSYIRGHLFKICHHALQSHLKMREALGGAKIMVTMRKVIADLHDVCKNDVQSYKSCPEKFESELPLPYWMCQPYVRPGPGDTEKRQKERERLKRPLDPSIVDSSENLSINKVKKRMRNPNKNFEPKRCKYERCLHCKNIKGLKCAYSLCKTCCKNKASTEVLDCEGHNILFKTKHEKRLKWEAEQKENHTANEVANDILGAGIAENKMDNLNLNLHGTAVT